MTVESAMRRIEAADDSRTDADDRQQQYEMYRKTFRALEDIEPDDDDEGIAAVADWIVERLETDGERPGSREVRRRARKFCERNGYDVSDNDWLGS
ncbi:hypothetical protein NGM10_03315 [Halorussus salilacus]|uniref:hypothetical protein n=1 Tax=Halorussus salilacus TaxID=2953750 RepID=UPI00209F811C|nr:hypothetical protein [Halorussus salilacus]USZ68773.1 hypothetical protein NGM10_03315 [Halorussus salilacus]